jgi:multiple sugar transport system substrate-binding protein
MANPVEVSICTNQGQDVSYLERLLYQFNPLARLKVLAWDDEWKEFTNYAVYRIGPDISQVGSPLVGDLVSMNALRPFTHRELGSMGGMEAYEPAAWTSSRRADFEQVWAIPWTADPRVLFYWRDMLEQAGVDEATAFAGIETMEATLEKLQKNTLATPWVLPTRIPLAALQTASSWVWGAGGEFVSQDGKKTRFCEPEALLGWQHYFDLQRFMPPERTG